ncbi:MAG: putative iron-regulated membrane protein [Phenylobacterium sp.]|jgi:uncharacterized iron-regulated membrane protein
MDKQFLKRLVEAHSWLGLIVSALLFVVFFAGSITLFKEEIHQWAFQPHYQLPAHSQSGKDQALPISAVFARVMQAKPFDAKRRATLVMPSEHMPYYRLRAHFFTVPERGDVAAEPVTKSKISTVIISPTTGEIIGDDDQFFLAKFIYRLHYQLNSSFGYEVIGFVTLFFFFALVSGIVIHARKLLSQFFRYQPAQDKRRKYLDMHTVIGVMTLPFTVMYAISGLIFNLLIIYQIAFVVVLYQGDEQTFREDSGYLSVSQPWQDKPWSSPDIDLLFSQTVAKYQQQPSSIRMFNYGDEGAAIHFRGESKSGFGQRFEVAYRIGQGPSAILFQQDSEHSNALKSGLAVVSTLHFGNYAGTDLRLIYFLLGLGVCVLIVTGNLLWIDKKARQRKSSAKTVALVTHFTLLGSVGVVLATVVAFLAERLLPPQLPAQLPVQVAERSDWLVYSFVLTLGITGLYLLYCTKKDNTKRCLSGLLGLSSVLLLGLVFHDWLVLSEVIIGLWHQGVKTVLVVDIGLLVVGIVLGYSGWRLHNKAGVQGGGRVPVVEY